ncbi:MAG: SIP domain-containing protein [Propionibacteriales bacterium]|nr:SIP domain-containing protein [Propionibacteriales bacterium]
MSSEGAGRSASRSVLPPGMAMALATVTRLERQGRYAWLAVEAPELAALRPRGAAPVLKVFIAPRPGDVPALPTFSPTYLPSWPSESERPTVRSYTAVDYRAADARIEFLAFDPGAGSWWVDHLSLGDPLGVIGFKHELVLDDEPRVVVAVGDRSGAGGIAALSRQLPPDVALHVVVPETGWPLEVLAARDGLTVQRARTDHLGFPVVDWSDVAATSEAPASATSVWLAGEVTPVAALRGEAIAAGVLPTGIVAQPYWRAGQTRDEFDAALSVRYRDAAARGVDIQDPVVAADLELRWPAPDRVQPQALDTPREDGADA